MPLIVLDLERKIRLVHPNLPDIALTFHRPTFPELVTMKGVDMSFIPPEVMQRAKEAAAKGEDATLIIAEAEVPPERYKEFYEAMAGLLAPLLRKAEGLGSDPNTPLVVTDDNRFPIMEALFDAKFNVREDGQKPERFPMWLANGVTKEVLSSPEVAESGKGSGPQ